jgi:hypothetical protein
VFAALEYGLSTEKTLDADWQVQARTDDLGEGRRGAGVGAPWYEWTTGVRSALQERCKSGWVVLFYAVFSGSAPCVLLALDHVCAAGTVSCVAEVRALQEAGPDRRYVADARVYTLALELLREPPSAIRLGIVPHYTASTYTVLMELLHRDELGGWSAWERASGMQHASFEDRQVWRHMTTVAEDMYRQVLADSSLIGCGDYVYREARRLVSIVMAKFVHPDAPPYHFWDACDALEDRAQGLTEEPVYVRASTPGATACLYTGGAVCGQGYPYFEGLDARIAAAEREDKARRLRDPPPPPPVDAMTGPWGGRFRRRRRGSASSSTPATRIKCILLCFCVSGSEVLITFCGGLFFYSSAVAARNRANSST